MWKPQLLLFSCENDHLGARVVAGAWVPAIPMDRTQTGQAANKAAEVEVDAREVGAWDDRWVVDWCWYWSIGGWCVSQNLIINMNKVVNQRFAVFRGLLLFACLFRSGCWGWLDLLSVSSPVFPSSFPPSLLLLPVLLLSFFLLSSLLLSSLLLFLTMPRVASQRFVRETQEYLSLWRCPLWQLLFLEY